jgi:hypothetical protein
MQVRWVWMTKLYTMKLLQEETVNNKEFSKGSSARPFIGNFSDFLLGHK